MVICRDLIRFLCDFYSDIQGFDYAEHFEIGFHSFFMLENLQVFNWKKNREDQKQNDKICWG